MSLAHLTKLSSFPYNNIHIIKKKDLKKLGFGLLLLRF